MVRVTANTMNNENIEAPEASDGRSEASDDLVVEQNPTAEQ